MAAAQSGSVTPPSVTRSAASAAAAASAGDPIAARIRSSASASGVALASAAGTREAVSSAMTSAPRGVDVAAGQRADDVRAPELGVDRLVQVGEHLARLAEHDVGRLRRPQRRKQRGDVRICLGHAGYSGTLSPISWRY